MTVYRHESGQVARPVPGSHEDRRLAADAAWTAQGSKAGDAPDGVQPDGRRIATARGTAKVRIGGKPRAPEKAPEQPGGDHA